MIRPRSSGLKIWINFWQYLSCSNCSQGLKQQRTPLTIESNEPSLNGTDKCQSSAQSRIQNYLNSAHTKSPDQPFCLLSNEETFNNNKAEGKSHSSNWEVHNIQHTVVLLMQSTKCIFAGTKQIQLIQNREVFIPWDNFLLKEDVLDVPAGNHSPELPRTELSSSSFASKEFRYQINGCHSSPLQGSGSATYLCK